MIIRWCSFTFGLSVTITVMSFAGVWQAGTIFGIILTSPVFGSLDPTSTSHMRQLATTESAGCSSSRGCRPRPSARPGWR